ncbi:MAG: hypothetical protein MI923_20275 [Phycisphaerales bacterium]|nr:hypothetical protein [Phycisphaerales bacterium]
MVRSDAKASDARALRRAAQFARLSIALSLTILWLSDEISIRHYTGV